MLRSLLAILLLLSAGARAADGPLTLELADGRILTGTCEGVHDGQLFVRGSDASLQKLALTDLVLLHGPPVAPAAPAARPPGIAPPAVALPPADDVLLLSGPDGDVLVGQVSGGDQYGLQFHLAAGADLAVPYDAVSRLLPAARLPLDRLTALAGAGKDDRLWLRRADGGLDTLTGVVDRVAGGSLEFEGAVGHRTFPLTDVVAAVLGAGKDAPVAPLAGLPVSVRLAGGSRLRAGLLDLDATHVVLATRCAPRLQLPASALLSLVSRGPGRTLLADLTPAQTDEHPTVGGAGDVLFPWRPNLSVTGQLLSVGGVPRASGLGVHAFSQLDFDLPPGCRALRVTAGLCDEVLALPAAASVEFRVLVDGKVAATARVVEGDAPAELRVDQLSGAHRLELVVTDGGDDDAGDRAAWVDGVLLQSEK